MLLLPGPHFWGQERLLTPTDQNTRLLRTLVRQRYIFSPLAGRSCSPTLSPLVRGTAAGKRPLLETSSARASAMRPGTTLLE